MEFQEDSEGVPLFSTTLMVIYHGLKVVKSMVYTGTKRNSIVKVEPPSSNKKKKQKTSGLATMASHQSPHCAQYSPGQAIVLANLNT
ncbi:hypothetical protein F2Q70_00017685 [Brassica cretica]|uniref:Uncharacterized protein n=1 Tax=Brassica cretica TaxID=69181 RepID=A0A8S9HUY4_BRACR|nr:hypothetical protein F2Q70_00017685 [Brassica cretica]